MNDTLCLIRLLDGKLDADDGAELRERLATDEALRDQWRELHAALATSADIRTWDVVDSFADAEVLAQAVELNGMNADDESIHDIADHQRLREVADLDRWLRAPSHSVDHATRSARDRMAGVVLQHLQSTTQTPLETPKRRERHQQIRAPQPRRPVRKSHPSASRPNRSRQPFYTASLVGAAAGVLLIVTLAGWAWFNRLSSPRDLANPRAGELVEQERDRDLIVNQTIEDAGNDEVVEDIPPEDGIARTPQDDTQSSPRVVMPEVDNRSHDPPPIVAVASRVEPLIWQHVVGLIASSDAETSGWSGVWSTAKGEQQLSIDDPPLRYRSLPQSWGRATTTAGIEVTLGEQTTASLKVVVAESATVEMHLEQGRLAIGRLGLDTIVSCRLPVGAFEARSLAEGGRLAWEANADSVTLHILEGELAIADAAYAAPVAIQWDATGTTPAVVPLERLAWLDPPAEPFEDQQWFNACLADPDIISALLNDEVATPLETQSIAAAWSMHLDPVTAVPLAAMSHRLPHREAAVAWLTSSQHDEQQLASVWHSLRPALADTELAVANWYLVARGTSPTTPAVLQEMAIGVGANQPLFVRQSAIHFLRLATRQRFVNYDPEAPTQQSIAEVRNFVRQFTTPNRPQRQRRPGR